MTEHQLAESLRRIANEFNTGVFSLSKVIMNEAERLDPPRKPREWVIPSNTIDCKGRPLDISGSTFFIHVCEVIE